MAAGPSDPVDGCHDSDRDPSGDAGPTGFVSGLVGGVAGFLGDLFASLPVPNFVKGFFGAPTCSAEYTFYTAGGHGRYDSLGTVPVPRRDLSKHPSDGILSVVRSLRHRRPLPATMHE